MYFFPDAHIQRSPEDLFAQIADRPVAARDIDRTELGARGDERRTGARADRADLVEHAVAWIAYLVHSLLNRFGEIQPSQMLVEGRLIPWSEVWLEFFWLVLVWACISLLVGFTAFSRKELAIYSGQG